MSNKVLSKFLVYHIVIAMFNFTYLLNKKLFMFEKIIFQNHGSLILLHFVLTVHVLFLLNFILQIINCFCFQTLIWLLFKNQATYKMGYLLNTL